MASVAGPEAPVSLASQGVGGTGAMITDDEAALYDRQIRLWGVEAQRRLRETDLLLIGFGGTGTELAKNIVLAGINSITIMDHREVTKYDMTANLFTERQVGRNRAEAGHEQLQSLNPMVRVSYRSDTIDPHLEDEAFLRQFQVVVLSDCFDKKLISQLNQTCRKLEIKFYVASDSGMFGFGFVDLGKTHRYIEEVSPTATKTDVPVTINENDGEPPAKKTKKEADLLSQLVEKTIDFVPFSTAMEVKAGKAGVGLTKRTSVVLIVYHTLLEFYEKFRRIPEPASRNEDVEELRKLEAQVLSRIGFDGNITKKIEGWQEQVFGNLSPICAITGGALAQDIIRAVTAKHTPIRNFFFVNGIDLSGQIESIGK